MERLGIPIVTDTGLRHRMTGLMHSNEEENEGEDEGSIPEDEGDDNQEDDGSYSV